MKATFRQLAIFVSIAETGSVVAASKQLFMSQAAASSALSELEGALDVALFSRHGRRLLITSQGRWLLSRAKSLLADAQAIEDGIKQLDPIAGELKIGVSQTIAEYLLPDLIRRFNRRHPSVELTVELTNSRQIQDEVAKGLLDIGMVESDVSNAAICQQFWKQDELVVVAAVSHPLTQESVILERLADFNWVAREQGSGTRAVFERALLDAGIQLRFAQQISHPASIVALIETGDYLSCLSRFLVEDAIAEGRLTVIETGLRLQRQFSLLYQSEEHLSLRAKAWLALTNAS